MVVLRYQKPKISRAFPTVRLMWCHIEGNGVWVFNDLHTSKNRTANRIGLEDKKPFSGESFRVTFFEVEIHMMFSKK